MAKPKFLSLDGVRTLVTYIKEKLATKVDKEPGKSLSDNNYSDADVAKLDSIESGAQENLIESISVNGNAQAIDQKNVNIAIPLVDATLTNSGQSADAKATGDAIAEVNQSLSQTATAIRQEFDDADNQLAQEMTQALEELSGTIPTKTSELSNDSDYTTKGYVDDEIAGVESAIPTKTSQLQNDSDYTTKQYVDGELDTLEASIPTKVSQLQNDSSYATTTQLTDGLATKEDALQYGTATAEDVGKAMMPKTVVDGKVTSWEFGEAGKVDDVQINGTSVLENKVANIPIAGIDKLGAVLVNPIYGISVSGFNGDTYINKADLKLIKEGSNIYRPIVPYNQHESAFYGLAKAAGDATQSSSSNAVGAYTDEAKTKIQAMLGVDEFNFSDRIAKGVDDNGNIVNGAIIEGNIQSNKASGAQSHAEGASTTASGKQSHAEGASTIANHKSQHVFGEFNIADPSSAQATNKGTYVEIVGNGSSTTRSNARTLDWNGNEVLAGKLTVGANPTNTMDVSTKGYVDTAVSQCMGVADIDATLSTTGKAADAKAVGDEISDIKADISATEDAIFNGSLEFPVVWENGTIHSGTSEVDLLTRKRTGFLSFGESEKIIITVPENKRIYGWYYSSPSMNDFINSVAGGWHTESFELVNDVGKYYRFTISDFPEESTRVDESGFTFVCNITYFTVLDDKIVKNEQFMRLQGRNLFNPADCENNFSLGTNGKASSNSGYWITGYINVSDVDTLLIPVDQKLRYCWYSSPDENEFIEYGTKYNPVSVVEGANYIRVCYSKTVVPFDDRWKLYFTEYNADPAFDTYQVMNYKNIELQDNQFFRISGNYTETFSIDVNRGNLGIKNQIVSFKGNYTGDVAPTIRFSMPYNHNTNLYTSQLYTIDEENMAWRIPAFPDNATRLKVTITISTGTTLAIKHLFNAFDNSITSGVEGYKLFAHLGVGCIYPTNTLLSFNAAASLGYPYCVTVPKRTSDGIWVCFHDDSNVGNTLKMPDGSNMPSSDASKAISDFTYLQLMTYDAGIKTNPFYGGEKVPTLESFFSLCQKTGMHPVLSIHPIPTSEQYDEIKSISDKYGLTKMLVLKFGSSSNIQSAFDKFGDEIESYILVVSTDRDGVQQMLDLGLMVNHATLGVEWTDDQITSAKVQKAKANNMLPGCFIQFGTSARYKELLDMGVYEITDDNNCSFGLNW